MEMIGVMQGCESCRGSAGTSYARATEGTAPVWRDSAYQTTDGEANPRHPAHRHLLACAPKPYRSAAMRLLVLLMSLAMPVVAYLSQRGVFGPDNGTVSDQYPTLLVASGYAFAIWGLIFLLDLIYGVWQASGQRRTDATMAHVAPWAAAGFALTALWMPLFSMGSPANGLYWVCLLVIFGALFCLVRCAFILSHDSTPQEGQWLWAWTPLSLHAGWMSVAAFLNLAQVIVAHELLPTAQMLSWSLVVFAAAAALLLFVNHHMHGNIDYAGRSEERRVGKE